MEKVNPCDSEIAMPEIAIIPSWKIHDNRRKVKRLQDNLNESNQIASFESLNFKGRSTFGC